jgi:hypothetical protein
LRSSLADKEQLLIETVGLIRVALRSVVVVVV